MAEYAYNVKHWKTAITVTDNVIVYFKNVIQAFTTRFKQLGGKIVDAESFTAGDKTIQNVVSRVNQHKADVIVTSTASPTGRRSWQASAASATTTPIMNSWAGDGTFWYPKNPKVSNYYYVTYASVFGDDPSAPVKPLIAQMKAIAPGRRRPAASSPARPRSTASPRRSSRPAARPTAPGWRRIWRSSRTCRRSRGRSASRRRCTASSAGPTGSCTSQNGKPKFVGSITAKKLGSL